LSEVSLQRKLGLSAVLAIVIGDMIGSGIFFTPGELARVASAEWQVFFIWSLCGLITLCGALTLAELATLLPRPGVYYHTLNEAYGPFAGFLQGWVQILISGPGSIAGIAILFGEFASQVFGTENPQARLIWGVGAIVFFVLVNLRGATWGGRTQVVLTSAKLVGLAALIGGGIFVADGAPPTVATEGVANDSDALGVLRFIGLGIAIVFFTYDGWIDATHVAGEVKNPRRVFPLAMTVGVLTITVVYLLVNIAFLRVVPLEQMQADPGRVASTVAGAAFGDIGAVAVNTLMWVSIFGALGGLVMTLPRLCYATVSDYVPHADGTVVGPAFRGIAFVSPKTSVPTGALIFVGAAAIAALLFFGSFARITSFIVVPLQALSMLMVSTVFILRPRLATAESFRTPGFPVVPIVYIVVVGLLLVSANVYNPLHRLIGVGLAAAAAPFYFYLTKPRRVRKQP
jgi:APA family basic amino acid/polyamine antiporter